MKNASKCFSLLGLANRAGKCISGEELVVKEIKRKKAKLVLLSLDASDNTTKKISDKCKFYEVDLRNVSDRYELGNSIGKDQRVVVAVTDQGFADKLKHILDQ
jgi:ribosomal protein L7Ae-like RNA K-turn-binding protein